MTLPNDKQIWIWGAKSTGRVLRCYLKRKGYNNFSGFIDNADVFAKTAVSFAEFKETHYSTSCFIIIASRQYFQEIAALCQEIGLEPGTGFINGYDLLGASFEIDLTSGCNLKCPSCPQGNYPVRLPKSSMSVEYFRKAIEKISYEDPNVSSVSLFCWSEPFLCRNLSEFVAILKEKSIACYISTNFSHEYDLESVVKQNIEYFRISVSGFRQEQYSKNHKGGNINLVLSNCYKLRYLLDKYKCDTLVDVAYHQYKDDADYDRMKSFCKEIGFSFSPFRVVPLPVENMLIIADGKEKTLQNIDISRFHIKVSMQKNAAVPFEHCVSSNIYPILPDGKVLVCDYCFDVNTSIIADDFLEVPLHELKKAKKNNPICKKCIKYNLPLIFNTVIDDTGNALCEYKEHRIDK